MERHSQLGSSVRFGPYELDVRSAELVSNGRKTLLHEQPFQVLLALLEHPGELVSREELVRRLWPDGTFVDYERGLNKAVNKLRDVLKDSAESPRFVETIPRRGYRFIAQLEGSSASAITSGDPVLVKAETHYMIWLAMGVALMLVVIAVAGYGVYSFSTRKRNAPFENFTITQITNNGKVTTTAISPDGKFLLSALDEHGEQSLSLHNIATDSDAEVIAPADAFYQSLTFSPDGNYIYFRKAVDKGLTQFNLLRTSLLGGIPQVVVRDIDGSITFSPEGGRMAYVRWNSPEVGTFQVLTANADGTDEKPIAGGRLQGFSTTLAWSPDGKQIASAIPDLGGPLGTIHLQDVASAKTRILGRFDRKVFDLAWLPDGRGLLATYGSPIGRSPIGFISNPGGQVRSVTKDTNSYQALTLSADGKTLATVQQRSSQTLYLMPAVGFAGQPPDPAPAQNRDSMTFEWATDGGFYFDSDAALLHISSDGRNKSWLLSDPTSTFFQPDSCSNVRYVLFTRAGHGVGNIWRLNADGSNPKQITDGTLDGDPQCSPDGKWAYYYDYRTFQAKRVLIDGGKPEVVPGTVIPHTTVLGPRISSDGKLLMIVVEQGAPPGPMQIALVDLDAGSEAPRRILNPDPRISGSAGFTPDVKALVYPVRENGVDNLWQQPLDNSLGHQITNFKSDMIQMFAFSPDGKTLGVMTSHIESDVVLLHDTGSLPQ